MRASAWLVRPSRPATASCAAVSVAKTDPEAKLFRKGRGKEAKLSYMGHVLMENRNGLVADFDDTRAFVRQCRDAQVTPHVTQFQHAA